MGLLDTGTELEYDYPHVPAVTALSAPTKPIWVLDFVNSGGPNGIAMTQPQMWKIKTIIHPFGHGGTSPHLGIAGTAALRV
jgi:hypothetical protein